MGSSFSLTPKDSSWIVEILDTPFLQIRGGDIHIDPPDDDYCGSFDCELPLTASMIGSIKWFITHKQDFASLIAPGTRIQEEMSRTGTLEIVGLKQIRPTSDFPADLPNVDAIVTFQARSVRKDSSLGAKDTYVLLVRAETESNLIHVLEDFDGEIVRTIQV